MEMMKAVIDKTKSDVYFEIINDYASSYDTNAVEYLSLGSLRILKDYCEYLVYAGLMQREAVESMQKEEFFYMSSPLDLFNSYEDYIEKHKELENLLERNEELIDCAKADGEDEVMYSNSCIYRVTADFLASNFNKLVSEERLKDYYTKENEA